MAFDFNSSTDGFRILYESVTLRMRRRARRYKPDFAAWLEDLISGFQREYEAWAPVDSLVLAYLEAVELKARQRKWLLLIGHAYLHISYDLPRVIAETLRQRRRMNAGNARFVYEELRDTFSESWIDASKDERVLGKIALVGRWIPRDYVEASIHYVLSLRYQSWSNAQVILGARSAADIERLRAELLDWVEFYIDQVPVSWNPIRWLAKLQAPLLRDRDDFLIGASQFREGPEKQGLAGPEQD